MVYYPLPPLAHASISHWECEPSSCLSWCWSRCWWCPRSQIGGEKQGSGKTPPQCSAGPETSLSFSSSAITTEPAVGMLSPHSSPSPHPTWRLLGTAHGALSAAHSFLLIVVVDTVRPHCKERSSWCWTTEQGNLPSQNVVQIFYSNSWRLGGFLFFLSIIVVLRPVGSAGNSSLFLAFGQSNSQVGAECSSVYYWLWRVLFLADTSQQSLHRATRWDFCAVTEWCGPSFGPVLENSIVLSIGFLKAIGHLSVWVSTGPYRF